MGLVIPTHDESCSPLDPVFCRHLPGTEISGYHKRRPATHSSTISVVVAGATVDACVYSVCMCVGVKSDINSLTLKINSVNISTTLG